MEDFFYVKILKWILVYLSQKEKKKSDFCVVYSRETVFYHI
jgi:hypothetical protein